MKQTVKAILARFNGDETAAFRYCQHIALMYPHLREEYMELAFQFTVTHASLLAEAAHA